MNCQRPLRQLLRRIPTRQTRCFSQFPGSPNNEPPRGSIPMPYITEVTVCPLARTGSIERRRGID